MMMIERRWLGLLGVLMCAWLAVPAIAHGQTVGGAIAGTVKDTTGAVLPGVTVEAASPALIEKVRVAVTDGQGNYKLLDLRPGVYTVTFTLSGFGTVTRDGIELVAGYTAPANADMKVGGVSETITVTGQAPVVDVQSPRTQNLLRAETLNALPSGMKDLTALVTLTLGATTSTLHNDVGGNQGELSTGISIHGSRGDDTKTNYDGFNTNVFYGGGGGQQRTYKFNTVGVQETQIDTSGNGADTETGGANVNMVPKDGGNRFSVTGNANYTSAGLSSGRTPSSLLERACIGAGLAPGTTSCTSPQTQNSMRKVYDFGVGVGGPIVKDRAWFFSANRKWGNEGYGANNYFNKSTVFYQLNRDQSRLVYSDQYYKDFGGRVTLQATPKNKFTFSENYQTACACWMSIGGTTAPESTNSFVYGPEYLTQASWTFPATNRLLFQAGYSYLRQQVSFTSQTGNPPVPGAVTINDTNALDLATGATIGAYQWGGLGASVINDNFQPQRQDNANYRFNVSYVTGSHAVKVGMQGTTGMYNTRGNVVGAGAPTANALIPGASYVAGTPLTVANGGVPVPNVAPTGGSVTYGFTSGVPTSLTEAASPFRSNGRLASIAFFANDQWTTKRLTLTLGLRYDHFNAHTLAITNVAGRFIPAATYAAADGLPKFSDITPRIGAAYDLFGTGKTAIKGSWGRYLLGIGAGALNFASPASNISTTASRTWNDQGTNAATGVLGNGNFIPDCDLNNQSANGECGSVANALFGQPTAPAINYDVRARTGWGTRDYNDQWSVSIQHQLRPGLGITGGFYHTAWYNPQVVYNDLVAPGIGPTGGYDSYCITAPTDSRLGPVSGQQVCGLTNVNFANKALVHSVWARTQDVPGLSGQHTEIYKGADLSVNWRFKGSGLLAGGISIGRTVTNDCFANNHPEVSSNVISTTFAGIGLRDPNYCERKDKLWSGAGSQVKLQAVYPLPADFVLAATYKNLPGLPIAATVTIPNAVVFAALGRNLSACTLPTGACSSTASASVILPGSVYDQRLNEVDTRLSRRFKVGRSRINGLVELYNIFNARTPQGSTATWGTLAVPGGAAAIPNVTFLRPSAFLGGRLLKFGIQYDF